MVYNRSRRVTFVRLLFAAALVCLASSVAFSATVSITVDENCHGHLKSSLGFNGPIPCSFTNDPGPGGLNNVMTYGLLNPPGGATQGDLLLLGLEPGIGPAIFDIVRFNGDGTLIFYSDNVPTSDSGADTPGPPGALYANQFTTPELGLEGFNGAIYTPLAGQPGYVPFNTVTYVLISDTPEPSSLLLFGSGLVGLAGFLRRKLQG